MSSQSAQQLWFTKPFEVSAREQKLPAPGRGQVLVNSLCSGISAGTEMLVYRGQVPDNVSLDASLEALGDGQISYPLQYGYQNVGRIEEIGVGIDGSWVGRTVFAFQPHASHYVAELDKLIPLPDDIDPQAAVLLANMETAVNLVLDAAPQLGDRVLVMGQGILGLLVTGILAQFPLDGLYTLDRLPGRRARSEKAGAMGSFDPLSSGDLDQLETALQLQQGGGADIVLELTGAPAALNQAVELCTYSGRIVVGSWYGSKTAEIKLGERFHRNRIEIVSSQVSSIAPQLIGRWDKARRFDVAWDMIRKCQPEQFVSHRLRLADAAEAYSLLDKGGDDVMQIIFEYQD